MIDAHNLVQKLKQQELRCRTGLLFLPSDNFGKEPQIAAALEVEYCDYKTRLTSHVIPESSYVDITLPWLVEDLQSLANAKTGEICVLVANFDLAAARLTTDEANIFWNAFLVDFPHMTRALLICVPRHAEGSFCIPDSLVRAKWRESGRVADWNQT